MIEFFIIFLGTLLNGFFAGSEIALISVRKTRIESLVKQGNRRAKIIKDLQANPENLFATIQIGISVLTIFVSAYAESSVAAKLTVYLERAGIPALAQYAHPLSFLLIIAFISYISLVLGELVPKSLGLRYAEKMALFAAYPIWWLSKISYVLIKFLNFSSNLLLKPFKDSTSFSESRLSEEELRTLIKEGRQAGTIAPQEHEILENVFEFSDISVDKIMTPSSKIIAVNIEEPTESVIKKIISSGYSRIPFYRETLDNVIGILYTKTLLSRIGKSAESISWEELLHPVFFVPNTQKVGKLLQLFQKNKVQMALVTNEHGEIEGLVTLEDILEEIVGDIADENESVQEDIAKGKDGTFVVKGSVSIIDLNKYFKSDLPLDDQFSTLSGFILDKLERFARKGDTVTYNDLQFVVKERNRRTISKVIVKRQQ